jgi:hypothetical protein
MLWAVLVLGAAVRVDAAQRGKWDPALLEQWVSAVEGHVPGSIDAPLAGAAAWDGPALARLWQDVHVLLTVVVAPRTTSFIIPPFSFESRLRSRTGNSISFRKDEREVLNALATRVRARGLTQTVHRAAVLHTDVMTTANGIAALSDAAAGPVTRWMIGDGTGQSMAGQSLHWELARSVLTYTQPDPRRDTFVRDWYRATVATAQAVEYFDALQIGHGLHLFPDDPELLVLAGAEREAMATPLFQAFARSISHTALFAGIRSEDDELAAAAGLYRRALTANPDLVEARVRLGRVLELQGRHPDAVEELRRALAGRIDAVHRYLALLFLGDALHGGGDAVAALDALEQAAAMAPAARAPYLAIARLSRERGNHQRTVSSLDRALADVNLDDVVEPLWIYRALVGRRLASLLDDVRARAGADRP